MIPDRDGACGCSGLRSESSFRGWDDYADFERTVREGGAFTEVPVAVPASNVGLVERWFECKACKTRWRLIEPDPPFGGTWERVS